MNELGRILLALLFIWMTDSCIFRPDTSQSMKSITPQKAKITVQEECIKSYQDFAYNLSKWDQVRIEEEILPLPPWQMEAEIPVQQGKNAIISIQTEIAREINGRQEIWIKKLTYSNNSDEGKYIEFLVFVPDSRNWDVVSADTDKKDIFVDELFLDNGGNIWGQTTWDPVNGKPDLSQAPALSRYDEVTGRFELVPESLGIPVVPGQFNDIQQKILIDRQGIFWIFRDNDGLYRFDPESLKTEKLVDFPDTQLVQMALSPDGSIYIQKFSDKIFSKEYFFHLIPGTIVQFIPKTRSLVSVNLPDDSWPVSSGMLFDHSGRFWLGAIGYRDIEGSWHLIYPNIEKYFDHAGDIFQAPPSLMLESSNGLLWYQKFLDSDTRAEGTAWYDPQTGKGCVFTNLPVDMIEDTRQQMWSFARGKLFKYQLNLTR